MQGDSLSLHFGLDPARLLLLGVSQRDSVDAGVILESLDGICGCDVHERAAELDGAYDGGVFKGVFSRDQR